MTSKPPARCCKAKNAAGKACRSTAVDKTGYCHAHRLVIVEKRRFGGPQPGSGRPRVERPTEIATRLIEEQLEPIIKRQITLALSDQVDPGVNTKNAQYLTNRVLGVPTQRTEVSGPGGGPVSIASLVVSLSGAAEAGEAARNGMLPDVRVDGHASGETG